MTIRFLQGRLHHPAALLTAILFSIAAASCFAQSENAQRSTPKWPPILRPPAGAPNVLVILTDDVGFGVSSTFGGPVPTPTLDALAKNGLRYNRFNTTALCSPTRASLLTGRRPHNVGMGNLTNVPAGYEGYTSSMPKSAGTIAEVLKQNGYNTAMFGKSHLTPEWETSAAGPFDRWPTGLGFEYFYGFLGADTSMWEPSIVENTQPIEPPHGDPQYHFEKDMANRAINWVGEQKAAAPDKPFFLYYASGLAHTPHHAPHEWLEKFRGQFDQGWDQVRAETFERQKAQGIIPRDAKISARPDMLPAWSGLSDEQKRVYARLMEAYAASVAYNDYQVGRLLDALKNMGELDNTLVIFIEGDNGSSAEGTLNGLMYEQSLMIGYREPFAELSAHIDDIGGPRLYNHFPAAWAWAMNTPFPYWKQVASQAGGTRNGMVISWPHHIDNPGGLRTQYAHVSDIMPTILEAVGIKAPSTLNGVTQKPIDGISLKYSLNNANVPSKRTEQIYEMIDNYGIYRDGWMAGTLPKRPPWGVVDANSKNVQRQWTLFNLNADFTTAEDLSKTRPDKLKELQSLFWVEAAKNHILPIHDPAEESMSAGAVGKPSLGRERKTFSYVAGIQRIPEDAAPHTIGHSFRIDAQVDIPNGGAQGVLVAHGGRFGGYAFYLKNNRPVFYYNALGKNQFRIASGESLQPGAHKLTAEFTADAPKPGTSGDLTLSVDDREIARGRIEQTAMGWLSITEGLDVGADTITPVSDDYDVPHSQFTGSLRDLSMTIE